MGLLSNLSIFALMVLPIVLLVRGHSIDLRRLVSLAALLSACLIAEATLLSCLTFTSVPLLRTAISVVAIPIMDTAVTAFVLNDPKARRVLRVGDAGDDAAAVLATAWAAADLALNRWFRWYRVISGPGFDAANLCSGAEAFAALVVVLLTARRVDKEREKEKEKEKEGTGSWAAVAAVRVAGAGLSAVVGTTLVGDAATIAALAAMRFLQPVEAVGRKNE